MKDDKVKNKKKITFCNLVFHYSADEEDSAKLFSDRFMKEIETKELFLKPVYILRFFSEDIIYYELPTIIARLLLDKEFIGYLISGICYFAPMNSLEHTRVRKILFLFDLKKFNSNLCEADELFLRYIQSTYKLMDGFDEIFFWFNRSWFETINKEISVMKVLVYLLANKFEEIIGLFGKELNKFFGPELAREIVAEIKKEIFQELI